ncbi:hypothetical protein TrRE_jg5209 [Triparma retinervis]|uniref:Uncharacterized protein n=1 Tax=Triparma retinervis TaxID=2557542 RepID=A0A9W7L5Q7_9STRA|nr:hypothetical protein TrRE_jg5209 [Triparma retinervis]
MQIATKASEKENEDMSGDRPMSESEYKSMESSKKKNAQLEYRALLDAQVARKNVPEQSPVRKLLKARRAAEDDVEIVPTMLKDRPW